VVGLYEYCLNFSSLDFFSHFINYLWFIVEENASDLTNRTKQIFSFNWNSVSTNCYVIFMLLRDNEDVFSDLTLSRLLTKGGAFFLASPETVYQVNSGIR